MPTFSRKKLSTQVEAIIHFLSLMDAQMIDSFLDDDHTYQDFPKNIFLHKLQLAFDQFQRAGDTFLNAHNGVCNGCKKGCKGISFVGNISRNYLDILIESKDDRVTDLYECADFVNDDEFVIKKERVYINKFYFSADKL